MVSDDEKRQRIQRAGERCPVCGEGYSIFYPSINPPTWTVNIECDHLLVTDGSGTTVAAHLVLDDPSSSWQWRD